ncbi:putative polygalacturonase protein [Phaeoacremonium minimum UCRPA7]|uniref:galacturonan 1,4-alpha-galacturonidase n=1 Tax=Phaeoacremonium minimum (strain UCR-PA7) TaxID=1286976 RepID=R8BDV8_PHAM7|nr:putative polygalacturonase protein [Phaeoacremonium minimum UCRPA7]EON97482.1 putative polygalacturonase protein [Phaeoacremonium minimum UCRPA7]
MNLTVTSNGTAAKNTDGWDTYLSDSVVIQNSVIQNTDDCVSFKPNSTNIIVQGLQCSGSHGISVGSLGQYVGEVDIAENIMVHNVTMSNCGSAARIKVYQDAIPNADGSLPTSSGGGSGYVRNVTYESMQENTCDYAIEITQCYGTKNLTLCNQYPVSVE